jgi:MFS family permease
MAYYPERYNFFQETISGLGGIDTYQEDIPNLVSQWIFSGGLYVCAILCVTLASFMVHHINNCKHWWGICRIVVLLIMAVFACLLAIPRDSDRPSLHYWGAIIFIASFDVLMVLIQIFQTKKMENKLDKLKARIPARSEKKLRSAFIKKYCWVAVQIIIGIIYGILVGFHLKYRTYQLEIAHIIAQKLVLVFVFISLHRIKEQDMDCFLPLQKPPEDTKPNSK